MLDSKWYELLSIENLPTKELIDYARKTFPDQWQKRFKEDMVDILTGLGRTSSGTVSLGLLDPESSQTLTLHLP